ncbi:type II toxin-antitoxin system VapC family toxin [Sphingomonas baiyangensis]|uniref:Ribonuclease VapC n=1 Tax=Sphingomonas baiyangensis TaxID=2572576 RepID=A0A4U1L4E8_9SPHN|nr:PIN domain nuclease [Sphingomonas baiyangensis]TKD51642.1 PIN domain nuclease [Sphingomonas baiyangensis]
MIFVDSSVWIAVLRGERSAQTERFRSLALADQLCTGDIMLTEVLQGVPEPARFERTRARMMAIPILPVCDTRSALRAAEHYRTLRSLGVTIRKTIDTLVATRCILLDLPLLHADRDFQPFVTHLGLRDAMVEG